MDKKKKIEELQKKEKQLNKRLNKLNRKLRVSYAFTKGLGSVKNEKRLDVGLMISSLVLFAMGISISSVSFVGGVALVLASIGVPVVVGALASDTFGIESKLEEKKAKAERQKAEVTKELTCIKNNVEYKTPVTPNNSRDQEFLYALINKIQEAEQKRQEKLREKKKNEFDVLSGNIDENSNDSEENEL